MSKKNEIILSLTIFTLTLVVSGFIIFLPKHDVSPVLGGVGMSHILPPQGWGVPNPNVTQANIKDNICNPSWSTKSIRPPVSYTNKLKAQQIKDFGYTDTNMADYEEDHIISLEIGGSPTDPHNLWPESYKTTPNAKDKDKIENYLHKEICNGQMTLKQVQQAISTDWTKIKIQ